MKDGKLKGKQLYVCRSCNKSFNDLAKSALSCTKLPLQTWIEYAAESFKCNHKKSEFKMPRPARKRGKQVKKRGISNEQICIATVIYRRGNLNVLEQILL